MTGRHAGPPLGSQARDATAPPYAGKHARGSLTPGEVDALIARISYDKPAPRARIDEWGNWYEERRYHGAPEDEDRCGSCSHPWQDECGCSCCPVPDPADHQEAPDGPR